MGIFLIIVILLFLLWPSIARLLRQLLANKTEDILRNAAGMPPRPGSRKARQQEKNHSAEGFSGNNNYFYRSRRRRGQSHRQGPIIPKEYAEDVEFVETKNFSQTTISEPSSHGTRQWSESQVSDAEWVEIRTSNRDKR